MNIEPLQMLTGKAITEAWRLSRDVKQVTPLVEIIQNDVPVLEMAVGNFLFTNFTMLEREIFTSARNHVMWARTSRVDDPREFTVPDIFNSIGHETRRSKMRADADRGVSQDHWRMNLPIVAHTTWVARHSYRDLLRLAAYFDYLTDHEKIDLPLRERFAMIFLMLREQASNLVGVSDAHHPNVGFDKLLFEGPVRDIAFDDNFNDNWQALNTTVPIGLRAQIVRHREIQFADDLFEWMTTGTVKIVTLADNVNIDMIASKAHWHKIISKRACWIAQSELWAPVLDAFDTPPLPCATGSCPYVSDNLLRADGKDPNPPCVIWQRIDNGGPLEINLHQAAQIRHAKGRPAEVFWLDKIMETTK